MANVRFKEARAEEKRRQYLAVLDWISPTDASLDQKAAFDTRDPFPGIGLWLLKVEKVHDWCENVVPRCPKLWIYGIPGAGTYSNNTSDTARLTAVGKTVLASVIIQDGLDAAGTTCCYFYCKHADPHRNTFLSLARTVLAQLLNQHRDLLPHLYDQLLSSGRPSLTSLQLCQELLHVALQHGQKTHVVIDGLDECDSLERRPVLSWFISEVEACNKQHPGRLRILFISQDEPDIRKVLQTSSTFRLTTDNIGQDIVIFVQHWAAKIREKFDATQSDVEVIEKSVCKRADGIISHYGGLESRLTDRQECFFTQSLWSPTFMHNHHRRI